MLRNLSGFSATSNPKGSDEASETEPQDNLVYNSQSLVGASPSPSGNPLQSRTAGTAVSDNPLFREENALNGVLKPIGAGI